jgi:GNAT superfamily N-acetyltransferase
MKIAENVAIRFMDTIADATQVVRINQQSALPLMSENALIEYGRKRNSNGSVVVGRTGVVGFVLYEFLKDSILIERMAVAPSERRCGIGAAIIDRMISKLANQRRKSLVTRCPLYNLGGLEFLRRNGFIATSMQGDLVEMVYSIDPDLTAWKS